MAKNSKEPKAVFPEIIADYKQLFGEDLISIILYGSATGHEFRPGKSDINFMIVLTERGIDRLDRAFKIVGRWRKRNVAIPLFVTEGYVVASLDVFPIEYLSIKLNHLLVYGKDILESLTFDQELIRLQCEREIKGKLLLLREAFLETSGKGRAMRGVISQSVRALIAVFEALLYLKGKELPTEKRGLIRDTAEVFEMNAGVFEMLLDIKEGKIKLGDRETTKLFKDYLKEVRELSKLVDALGG
ncbi:MAG: hypothetical protein SV775_13355 [Thermodesulfobacteriota bacterium]|nr:hypothetical protein [Thermodesulfobacteriota bacterium]